MDDTLDRLRQQLADAAHSPVFARLADALLDAGELQEAWAVCREGIRLHPRYVTGHVVTAKAAACLGRFAEAHDLLLQALDILPHCPAAQRLLDALPDIELRFPQRSHNVLLDTERHHLAGIERPPPRRRPRSVGNLAPDRRELARIAESIPMTVAPPVPPDILIPTPVEEDHALMPGGSVEDNLEHLAQVLETARIPIVEEDPDTQPPEARGDFGPDTSRRPATETLASIYLKQGRVEQAIEIYEILARRSPQRRHEFHQRIEELRAMPPEGELAP